MQILMTGASITAAQAERWGIVNEVTPPADLMQRAWAIAGAIAANPPLAVQACRELATRGRELTLADGMRLELALSHLTRASQDSKEALSAYVEKRAPVFRGE
jgi:enoyl-CoA hydratase/carnithine racemase